MGSTRAATPCRAQILAVVSESVAPRASRSVRKMFVPRSRSPRLNQLSAAPSSRSSSFVRNDSPSRPQPRSRSATPESQYVTESRSGDTCRPCIRTSSPVLTTTVTSAGGTARTSPRRNFPAPTPPASAATFMDPQSSRVARDGRRPPPPAPTGARPSRGRQGALDGRGDGPPHRSERRPRATDGPCASPPRAGPRHDRHLFAEGVRPAHDALPRPLPLLHVREAAGQARRPVPHAGGGRGDRRSRAEDRLQGNAVHAR